MEHPDADVIIPSGDGTPQPIQMGFFIVRRRAIPAFIKGYTDLQSRFPDNIMSPEKKIANVCKELVSAIIPLGFGRARPIIFSSSHFFVKHMNENELRSFAAKVAFDLPSSVLPAAKAAVVSRVFRTFGLG